VSKIVAVRLKISRLAVTGDWEEPSSVVELLGEERWSTLLFVSACTEGCLRHAKDFSLASF
jgi:hypothetical protein